MMPPPVPRPPTAQGHHPASLPHRSPTIPGGMGSMHDMQSQRPQSRMVCFVSIFFFFFLHRIHPITQSQRDPTSNTNGFKQFNPSQDPHSGQPGSSSSQQTIHLAQQNPYPPSSNANLNNMGMPNMGLNMGIPGSPRIGGGMNLGGGGGMNAGGGGGGGGLGQGPQGSGMMGPPGLPRSISSDSIGGGMMNMPGMNMNLMNMNMNLGGIPPSPGPSGGGGMSSMMNANVQRGSPRPQSSMDMVGNINMGGINNMNLGSSGPMGMHIDIPTRPNSMAMPQQGPQTPLRQGSLPPAQSTPTPGIVGIPTQLGGGGPVGMRQGSLPPTNVGSGSGAGGGRGPQGMNLGGMNMNMGPHSASSSTPHVTGGSGGPQGMSMSMAPSLSTSSSMGSMAGLATIGGGSQTATGNLQPSLSSSSANLPTTTPSSTSQTNANAISVTSSTPGLAPPPPLPNNVTLNPKTTQITLVPLLTSLTSIPALSTSEVDQIKDWMETDKEYDTRLRAQQKRMADELHTASAGPMWWERGAPGNGTGNWSRYRRSQREGFDVRYPKSRRDAGRSHRKGVRREGLRLSVNFFFSFYLVDMFFLFLDQGTYRRRLPTALSNSFRFGSNLTSSITRCGIHSSGTSTVRFISLTPCFQLY